MKNLEFVLKNVKKQLELEIISKEKAVEILSDAIYKSRSYLYVFRNFSKRRRDYYINAIRSFNYDIVLELCKIIVDFNSKKEVKLRKHWKMIN